MKKSFSLKNPCWKFFVFVCFFEFIKPDSGEKFYKPESFAIAFLTEYEITVPQLLLDFNSARQYDKRETNFDAFTNLGWCLEHCDADFEEKNVALSQNLNGGPFGLMHSQIHVKTQFSNEHLELIELFK